MIVIYLPPSPSDRNQCAELQSSNYSSPELQSLISQHHRFTTIEFFSNLKQDQRGS